MKYYLEDLFFWIMGIIMAIILVVVIVFAFISIGKFNTAVKQVETSTGCEYLGSPKGASRVAYFDCNGVIETKRILK